MTSNHKNTNMYLQAKTVKIKVKWYDREAYPKETLTVGDF